MDKVKNVSSEQNEISIDRKPKKKGKNKNRNSRPEKYNNWYEQLTRSNQRQISEGKKKNQQIFRQHDGNYLIWGIERQRMKKVNRD